MLKPVLILLFYLRISFAKDNFDVLSYDISLNTRLDDRSLTYKGSVDIRMKFNEGYVKLRIPRGDYEITRTQLTEGKTFKDTHVPGMMHDPLQRGDNYFVYNNRSVKTKTPYILRIEFKGNLRPDDQGLYHYKYEGLNNAFAGFKDLRAHLSIPCFDDFTTRADVTVRFKNRADFLIKMRKDRSKRYWALVKLGEFNIADSRYISSIHYKAIPMSMLGIVIGQFQLVANITDHSRTFDLVTSKNSPIPIEAEDKLYDECALNISTTLVWIEKFFNVPSLAESRITVFMLPEVSPYLVDNNKYIYYPIQSVLNMHKTLEDTHNFRLLTASKMARMYLANLLLPKQGKDFWVNHGLSNYLQYKVMGGLYTEYNFEQLMFLESRYHAMKEDLKYGVEGLESGRVSESLEIQKGGNFFWMLESILSEENFKKFMNYFILSHRKDSVNWTVLVDSLSNFTREIVNETTTIPQNIYNIMSCWTHKPGYPMITFIRKNSTTVEAFQLKLGYLPNYIESFWIVPVKFRQTNLSWMEDYNIFEFPKEDWNLANLDLKGYYRLDYAEGIWNAIIEKLKNKDSFKDITTFNRARLIDDSLNLAIVHSTPYNYALKLLDYLEHELDYLPWAIVYENMKYLLPKIHGTEGAKKIQTIVGKHAWTIYYHNIFKLQKAVPRSILEKFIKLLIDLACSCENKDCLEHLGKVYTVPSLENSDLHHRDTSCCYAARASNVFADKVYDAFKATSDRETKDFYLECAACDRRYNETIEKWNQTLKPYEMNQFLQHMISKSRGHEDVIRKLMWKAEKCCSDDVDERNLYCGSIHEFKIVIQNAAHHIVTDESFTAYDNFITEAMYLKRQTKPCDLVTMTDLHNLWFLTKRNKEFRDEQSRAIMHEKAPEPSMIDQFFTNLDKTKAILRFVL